MITLPFLRNIPGMIVCIGRLPPPASFGWPACKAEARATVLEVDAEFLRGDPRAKAPENRINQRHRHAVTVHHGDVDRVFVHRLGQRRGTCHRAFGVDQRGKSGGGFRRQHVIKPRRGFGDEAVAGVIGQFGRLGLDMGALGAERVHRGQVEVLEDVQHQDRRGTLAVWRMLDQFDAFVIACDRIGVSAGGGCKIFQRVRAAHSACSEVTMSSATSPS